MKRAIFVVLVLILLLLGGVYWNFTRERNESERRNRETARQAAEAERRFQESSGY